MIEEHVQWKVAGKAYVKQVAIFVGSLKPKKYIPILCNIIHTKRTIHYSHKLYKDSQYTQGFYGQTCFLVSTFFLDMYTNLSITNQSKKKKRNWKYKWQSHSFRNNFCNKPKDYELEDGSGEDRCWNSNWSRDNRVSKVILVEKVKHNAEI